jgi:hypothetical protein
MLRVVEISVLIIGCVFVFFFIDCPPDNIVDVKATVISSRPGYTFVKSRGRFHVTQNDPGAIRVRLENGAEIDSSFPIFAERCVVGGEATSAVRIGRITHHFYAEVDTVCK